MREELLKYYTKHRSPLCSVVRRAVFFRIKYSFKTIPCTPQDRTSIIHVPIIADAERRRTAG